MGCSIGSIAYSVDNYAISSYLPTLVLSLTIQLIYCVNHKYSQSLL